MALDFTGMIRAFSRGSRAKIEEKLDKFFSNLAEISTQDKYESRHRLFCRSFTSKIWTAPRRLRNGKVKPSQPSSYGHAAKVLDIAAKVYVYYCTQPNAQVAQRIMPFLKGAIDNPIMVHLKTSKHAITRIGATSIQEIDEETYKTLHLVLSAEATACKMHPAQFEDKLFRQLNRTDRPNKTQ